MGTARNTTSKVWYTVADGVLSDVYYPTIDNTNVETLQYVVTDGSTFTDLQTRDMTYTAKSLDRSGLVCRVTSRDKHDRYSLITDYITDPSRASVVMHTTFYPKHPGTLALYARYDATVNGNGGGGSGNGGADNAVIDTTTGSPVPVSFDTNTATNAANRDYATPVYSALRASRPFLTGIERVRRHGERRPHGAGHHPHTRDDVQERQQRQRRADRTHRPASRQLVQSRPGLRHHAVGSCRHRGPERDDELRQAVRAVPRRLVGVRLSTEPPAAPEGSLSVAACPSLQHLLPVGQRAEGK